MSEPFLAEIRIFGFNFAPKGWAMCNGQLLPISQYTALFSLLGTNYGGDGRSTFALPDFQGSVPLSQGQGAGLSEYFVGQSGGSDSVTLLTTEIPMHSHGFNVTGTVATVTQSNNSQIAKGQTGNPFSGLGQVRIFSAAPPNTLMDPQAVGPTGGNQPHNNLMPYLTLNFCIAMQGIFPARP